MPTAAIFTLGCRLNQADSGMLAELLRRRGFTLVPWGAPAELFVINSCTVTAGAAQKTRQAVRAVRRRFPESFIVVAGCDVDIHGGEWLAESAVDLLVPNRAKPQLAEFLPAALERLERPQPLAAEAPDSSEDPDLFRLPVPAWYPHRTRANLKVQEGCDFFCSYCIVPHARGRPRSRAWDDCLEEARELLRRGHRELVVTGVNLMLYQDHGRGLPELVEALAALPGEFRVRVSSVEPGPDLPRLLDVLAAHPGRVCRFLHVPLQYGEDTMLAAMNRRGRVADFARFAFEAVERIPGLCLGTDIIVGFPGEDEARFSRCRAALERLPVAYFHVFPYSRRKGTPAAERPGAPPGPIAARRSRILRELSQWKSAEFARSQLGRVVAVLPEGAETPDGITGWSDNYLRVVIPGAGAAGPGNPFRFARVESVVEGRRVVGKALAEPSESRQAPAANPS